MTTIAIGGRLWATALDWRSTPEGGPLPRGEARAIAARSRQHWRADGPTETGFAGGDPSPQGLPVLALVLRDLLAADRSWLALLAADGEDDPRVAWIEVRDGRIVEGGDRVFADAHAAVAAAERMDDPPPAIYAAGDVPVEATALDPALLEADDRHRVVRTRRRIERRAAALAGFAGLAAAAALLAPPLLDRLFPEAEPVAEIPILDPSVATVIDGSALLDACHQAFRTRLPRLAGWEVQRFECHARLRDEAVTGGRPELEDRAAAVVRWTLSPGLDPVVHRRLAERRMARLYAGTVDAVGALAVLPLAPAVRRAGDVPPPNPVAWRDRVERRWGLTGAALEWRELAPDPGPGPELAIASRRPFPASPGASRGLEAEPIAARWSPGEGWRLELRRPGPIAVAESRFRRLSTPLAVSSNQTKN